MTGFCASFRRPGNFPLPRLALEVCSIIPISPGVYSYAYILEISQEDVSKISIERIHFYVDTEHLKVVITSGSGFGEVLRATVAGHRDERPFRHVEGAHF